MKWAIETFPSVASEAPYLSALQNQMVILNGRLLNLFPVH